MKKILLLGGTGAMGQHLAQLLKIEEVEVFVTSRSNRKSMEGCIILQGNAHDLVFLQNILKRNNWDVIVDFMVYTTAEFTQRLSLLLESCKQYIFLSSSRVYADTQPKIDEDSARLLDVSHDKQFLKTDEYALSKARAENVLRDSKFNNWTIVRPYITYSEIRLQLGVLEKETWLYRALHNRTIVFSKDIASKYTTLTYAHDVARGIVALFDKKEALRQSFHITVDESHTWKEIFELYIHTLENIIGHKLKVMMIDQNPRVKINQSKWQVVYDRYYNRRFDNTKIRQFIDNSSFKPTLQGLEECLSEFVKKPKFNIDNWSEHAMYDRMTGEWTRLSEIPTWQMKIKYLLRRTILPIK